MSCSGLLRVLFGKQEANPEEGTKEIRSKHEEGNLRPMAQRCFMQPGLLQKTPENKGWKHGLQFAFKNGCAKRLEYLSLHLLNKLPSA